MQHFRNNFNQICIEIQGGGGAIIVIECNVSKTLFYKKFMDRK